MSQVRWWFVSAAVLGVALLALAGTGPDPAAPAVQAQSVPRLSEGCAQVNRPDYDALYTNANPPFTPVFNAGDQVRMTAGLPTSQGTPTLVTLRVNATVVDASPFPGTVTYTFPATAPYDVFWGVNAGSNATWIVECIPAGGITPIPVCLPLGRGRCPTATGTPPTATPTSTPAPTRIPACLPFGRGGCPKPPAQAAP